MTTKKYGKAPGIVLEEWERDLLDRAITRLEARYERSPIRGYCLKLRVYIFGRDRDSSDPLAIPKDEDNVKKTLGLALHNYEFENGPFHFNEIETVAAKFDVWKWILYFRKQEE